MSTFATPNNSPQTPTLPQTLNIVNIDAAKANAANILESKTAQLNNDPSRVKKLFNKKLQEGSATLRVPPRDQNGIGYDKLLEDYINNPNKIRNCLETLSSTKDGKTLVDNFKSLSHYFAALSYLYKNDLIGLNTIHISIEESIGIIRQNPSFAALSTVDSDEINRLVTGMQIGINNLINPYRQQQNGYGPRQNPQPPQPQNLQNNPNQARQPQPQPPQGMIPNPFASGGGNRQGVRNPLP